MPEVPSGSRTELCNEDYALACSDSVAEIHTQTGPEEPVSIGSATTLGALGSLHCSARVWTPHRTIIMRKETLSYCPRRVEDSSNMQWISRPLWMALVPFLVSGARLFKYQGSHLGGDELGNPGGASVSPALAEISVSPFSSVWVSEGRSSSAPRKRGGMR